MAHQQVAAYLEKINFQRALSAALGLFFALFPWQTAPLCTLFFYRIRSVHCALIAALFAIYGLWALQIPSHPTRFYPTRIERSFQFGSPLYIYKGRVDGGAFALYFSKQKLDASRSWQIEGALRKGRLELSKEPKIVQGSFSLAQMRFDLREKIASLLKKNSPPPCADIATAFFLGRSAPKQLKNAFRRAGLSHLLCLSGFHFATFSALLSWLWRKTQAPRLRACCFIFFLSLYALIVGDTPSVLRAYGGSLIYFAAPLFGRESSALESLGLIALAEMLINPWNLFQVSFQLSYGVTAALLLFYQPIKKRLGFETKPRGLRPLDLHAFVFAMLFLRVLALQIAVSIAAIPLSLAHFGIYPLGGAIFNLIYPPLLLAALALFPLTSAPLSALITSLNFLPRFLTLELFLPLPPWLAGAALVTALTLKATPGRINDYYGDRSSVG